MCLALLTTHGRPYPLGGMDGEWAGRHVSGEGGGVGGRTEVGM